MTIENFRVHRLAVDPDTVWIFLQLDVGKELRGFGEALLAGRESLLASALEQAAAGLLGQSLQEATAPPKPLANEHATGLLEATVQATIDQCLWDLRAQAAGLPLHRMLGPTRRTAIPLYANVNRGTRDRSPEGFAAAAAAACAAGFDAVKIAPFDGFRRANAHHRQGRNAFALALQRIAAVREAIGTERLLMIDCHCRLDLASALRLLDNTSAIRIDWLEDPLPYLDLDDWARLKAGSRAPLIGGETARGTRDLLPFLDRGLWDVLMPDIRFFGGVTELVALASLAAQYQVQIAPHNPRGPVATLASAHAMATCPVFYHLEYQFGDCGWRDALTQGSERIASGTLQLGDAPGLGLSWNEAVAKQHALR